MNKSVSALAVLAAIVTAVPASVAVVALPQTAEAAVKVVVGPGGGYYYGGRHYRNRVWRGGRWAYSNPIVVAGPVVVGGGGYYYGGRRWKNRNWECHRNPYRGKVCKYRYW
jgi:hypothetical protein